MTTISHPLHVKAFRLAKQWLVTEAELLEVIQSIDQKKLFRTWGFGSLHAYLTTSLKLSDSQAYTFTSVARKSLTCPKLKEAILAGEISANTARKVLPVLTPENQTEWLEKAKTLKQKELERAVAAQSPHQEIRERIKPVCAKRLELKCGITPELEAQLKRIQDWESQRLKRPCSLEDALLAMAQCYLEKKDVRQAKRERSLWNERPTILKLSKQE